ncbi:helix-turn-helix transcriptional regulator [Runella zeae]|uniref:helix-turn-helix transcriptional regulator n=1 Tax=Runella zeae TaxID=94255 RepID=UPI0012F79DCB|nr:helix-turn-helix domain-containing protein [Runella zeae]
MIATQTLLMPFDAEARAELKSIFREAVKEELANFTPPTPKHDLPEYLTRKETAKLYRISLVTLHEWDKAGIIPKKVIVNSRVRYRRDEILATIETAKQIKHKKRVA